MKRNKKSELEIISIEDLSGRFGVDFRKTMWSDPLITNYSKIKRNMTPYVKLAKTEEKSTERIEKEIRKYAAKIGADLAIVEYTNTHYPDNTFSQDVIYYKRNSD